MADSVSACLSHWSPYSSDPGVATTPAVPLVPGCRSRSNSLEVEKWLAPVPVTIVTKASELPEAFLHPDEKTPLVVGFDCEGVNLARYGRLCIMQLAFEDAVYLVDAVVGGYELMQACKPALESVHITKVVHDCKRDSEALYFQYDIKLHNVFDTQIAYTLLEEQQGKKWVPDDYISFVDLLSDERYCGVVYDEKEEVRSLLKKDPQFWTHRPWTEMMTRVAADDVRFLLCIHHKMISRLQKYSMWQLSVRGALYCRCFCAIGDGFVGWPSPPPLSDFVREGDGISSEEEVLAVVDVLPGKMGRIIGKKGSSILSIKQSCRADIFVGGAKGPPDKVFVIGAVKEVRKAEAILRGRML
ncbi:hypothetical protein R1sor_010131 [Riccia sorocarpa]|uniref:3'-5' exonuclease domain-containing protein n=1 Tax=Riccia sorocarpa TaxID=122646 RepID=A0ABD3I0P2_9MARC